MAFRLLLFLAIIMFFCIAHNVSSDHHDNIIEDQNIQVVKGSNRKLFRLLDCGRLCKVRCGAHSRPNVCLRACGTCCARCHCVPPGTSGNRHKCGRCYTGMLTHGNKPKCP